MEREFSAFSLMLIDIARSLNEDEQSMIKLLLQSNKIVTRAELERMINGAEIIRELLYKNLVTDDDVSLLKKLLRHVDRKDLVRDICKYEDIARAEEIQDDALPSSQESISDEEKLYKIEKHHDISSSTDFEMHSQ